MEESRSVTKLASLAREIRGKIDEEAQQIALSIIDELREVCRNLKDYAADNKENYRIICERMAGSRLSLCVVNKDNSPGFYISFCLASCASEIGLGDEDVIVNEINRRVISALENRFALSRQIGRHDLAWETPEGIFRIRVDVFGSCVMKKITAE